MKKLFIMVTLCVCALVINIGCSSGFKSETYNISDELEAYTVLAENGDTLLGVRSINGDGVVITPSKEWYSASVLCGIIEIVTTEKTSRYFTTDGAPIGHSALNMLDTIEGDSIVFYHGRGDSCSVFYFPVTGNIIEAAHYYIAKHHVCLHTQTGFDFRTYEGDLLWSVPDEEFYLLKKANADPEVMFVAIVKNNKAQIYNTEGKYLKQMSAAQWKKVMRKGKKILQIGGATLMDIPKSIPI